MSQFLLICLESTDLRGKQKKYVIHRFLYCLMKPFSINDHTHNFRPVKKKKIQPGEQENKFTQKSALLYHIVTGCKNVKHFKMGFYLASFFSPVC